MIKYLMRFKFLQNAVIASPAAAAAYIPFAAVAFGEHSLGQQLGISLAMVAVAPAAAMSVMTYKIKQIPKNWTVNVINESDMDGRSYKHEIVDENDRTIFPYAQSDAKPFPLLSVVSAAKDCERIKVASDNGKVTSFRPGLKPLEMLSQKQLTAMERDAGLHMPDEEEVATPETGLLSF